MRAKLSSAAGLVILASAWAQPLRAQWQAPLGPDGGALGAPVGSDVERYVRALALGGTIAPVAWAARPIGAEALTRLLVRADSTTHPWGRSLGRASARRAAIGGSAFASYNSAFPWGANDGPMWQGRGATGAIGLAATWRAGPLRATLAPSVFVAQNTAFDLLPTQVADPLASPFRSLAIDRPQRFGTAAYARVTPGESTVELTAGPWSAGLSTATVGWGPGESFAGILGPNAGGFPHVFVGTDARGIRVPYVGRFAGRYVAGLLAESRWSPVTPADTFVNVPDAIAGRRAGLGVSASWLPALLPGLEVGASRFFHSPWRRGNAAWSAWSKPFEGLLKSDFGDRNQNSADPNGDPDNQLASFHARWVFPRRGVEVGFEYLREDHAWDRRDLAQEPEQNGAMAASIRAITHRSPDRLAVLTLEYFDGDVRPVAQQRPNGQLYVHGTMRQGHTLVGQLLGAPIGIGAVDGQRASWERFRRDDRLQVTLQRWRSRTLEATDPQGLFFGAFNEIPNASEWILDGSVSLSRRVHGRWLSIDGGIAYAGAWQFASRRANVYLRTTITQF